MAKNERHVVPSSGGKGWDSKKPGAGEPESHHRTQANAEKAAKSQLAGKGGEVVIHGRDGKIRDKDAVPPARDPNPPRDKKH